MIERRSRADRSGRPTRLPGRPSARPRSQVRRDTSPAATGVAGLPAADLNLVRDGFERFDLLDEPGALPPGALRPTPSPTPPSSRSPCCASAPGLGAEAGDGPRARSTTGWPRRLRGRRRRRRPGVPGRRQSERGRRVPSADAGASQLAPAGAEVDGPRPVAWPQGPAPTEPVADGPPAHSPEPRSAREPACRNRSTRPVDRPTVDLTVVVVFYNMRREAARTLRLAVAVLPGGHRRPRLRGDGGRQRLRPRPAPRRRASSSRSGPEFRYIDLGDEAQPSPVPALNGASRPAGASTFALMIDGAHVLTPGVLRFGMAGLRHLRPAIVATQQWYVGPGQQGDAMDDGYDQAYEDRLFERIGWPPAGYRLFEIGHFVGDRDWLDGLWESNCLFVPRALLEQVGGFDERFSMAGRRLRQPRALRAAGLLARRHRGHHPRRGLVPPAPRRHHHQPDRGRAPSRALRATASSTRSSGGADSGARARTSTSSAGSSRTARRTRARRLTGQDVRGGPGDRGARRAPRRADAHAPTSSRPLHRGLLAEPAVEGHHLARAGGGGRPRPTCSPTRSC